MRTNSYAALLLFCLPMAAPAPSVYIASCPDRSNCTAALQHALDYGSADTIIIPYATDQPPYQTAPLFIRRNNFNLIVEAGVVIEAMVGSFKGTDDCLLTAEMVSNVSVNAAGATLK